MAAEARDQLAQQQLSPRAGQQADQASAAWASAPLPFSVSGSLEDMSTRPGPPDWNSLENLSAWSSLTKYWGM